MKTKSPSECIDKSSLHNLSKENSPVEKVKSSTKSKAHSKEKSSTAILPSVPLVSTKEKEIESVTEHIPKPSKSKKSTVVPSSATVVDTDNHVTASVNTSVFSAINNSVAPNNKHKFKTTKKSKKTVTRPHPAFYFVSTYTNVTMY